MDAAQAQVDIASTNLSDTIVTAPFNGKLSMDDVNIGTFATAGTTALVTISSSDPIYVQFDMSENEYLALNKSHDGNGTAGLGNNLKIRLSDGSIYGYTGKIVQVNPNMNGGQLSMKQPSRTRTISWYRACMPLWFRIMKSPKDLFSFPPKHWYSS